MHAFQQAAQHFSRRRSHVQSQRHDEVHHHMSWQIPLPNAFAISLPQHDLNRPGTSILPSEADTPLVIDPDAILSQSIPYQGL